MKVKRLHGLGNHLMMDGYSESEIGDEDFIKGLMEETVIRLGMNKISEPLVLYHHAKEESESGVTGTIILAESNITIHTYPNKKYFCMDIFSCNEFDLNIIDYLVNRLKITIFKKKLVKRGAE